MRIKDFRSQPTLPNGTLLKIHVWEGSSVTGCLYTIYEALGFILRTEHWGGWEVQLPVACQVLNKQQ